MYYANGQDAGKCYTWMDDLQFIAFQQHFIHIVCMQWYLTVFMLREFKLS